MSYDQFLMKGMSDPDGRLLWASIKDRCPTHTQVLQEMRVRQKMLAMYSKHNTFDAVQSKFVRDIQFLETMAWRMYMFGARSIFSILPGSNGELRKRQRTDPKYWRYLEQSNKRHGTIGCEQLSNLYRKIKKSCYVTNCSHEGQKQADKWLKREMRQEWNREILSKHKY